MNIATIAVMIHVMVTVVSQTRKILVMVTVVSQTRKILVMVIAANLTKMTLNRPARMSCTSHRASLSTML